MKYAAAYRSWLTSPPALGASVAALGAWVRLAAYAADLECGEGDRDIGHGRLVGMSDACDRAWLTVAGVTRAEVDAAIAAGLVTADGGDLLVGGYDLAGQRAVEKRRKNGNMGGRKPAGKPKPNRPDNRPLTGRVTGCEPGPNPLPLLSSPLLSSPGGAATPAPKAQPQEPAPTAEPDDDATAYDRLEPWAVLWAVWVDAALDGIPAGSPAAHKRELTAAWKACEAREPGAPGSLFYASAVAYVADCDRRGRRPALRFFLTDLGEWMTNRTSGQRSASDGLPVLAYDDLEPRKGALS